MKNLIMKQLLFCFVFGALLTSCAPTYKYISVESNELARNEKKEFTHNTDSLNVTFGFDGNGVPLRLKIENKRHIPLYIDWSRSALIVEGKRFSLYKNEGLIDLNGTSTTNNQDNDINNIDLRGNIAFNEALSFIPPLSYENKIPLLLNNKLNFSMQNTTREKVEYHNGTYEVTISNYNNQYRSPEFRVYLTMSFDSKFEESFDLDQTFHIDEIMETKLAPDLIKNRAKHQGLIISRPQNNGLGLGILALGTLFVLLMVNDIK